MTSASTYMDTSALFRVDGLVATITGGGTGIGLIMARALAANGAKRVYILGRRLDVLTAAVTSTTPADVLVPIQCDVTSKDDLQAAVDRITEETGYINLLIANSGVMGPTDPGRWGPGTKSVAEVRKDLFTDYSMEAFTSALQVNVVGVFFTITAFIELLDAGNKNALKGGFGRPEKEGSTVPVIQSQIVVTSSIAAFIRGWMSTPIYTCSKAAVWHVTKQASSNLAPYGIRANALAPGLYPSELASLLIGQRKPEEEPWGHPMHIPSQRFGTDADMAGTILYLASRAGSYCNGMILAHDGGRLGQLPTSYC